MTLELESVDLIVFDTLPSSFSELPQVLASLGYCVHIHSFSGNKDNALECQASIMLVCMDSECVDFKHLESLFSSRPDYPRFCLLDRALQIVPGILLSQVDEFCLWPCSSWELKVRLDQFLPESNQRADDEHRQLLEQFVGLNLVGRSSVFVKTLETIKRLARCPVPVLIEGETGTGKENAARAVHYLSVRGDHAFIPVNCGAIPDNLLESELFGYEKGAFTDAKKSQLGLVAMADKGTLFLDEVDSLSNKAQTALLRFLQNQEYRPIGGQRYFTSTATVIAATNRSLSGLVKEGSFREDLYYRLNVVSLRMPPLRERSDDIELIAEALLNRFSQQYDHEKKTIHPKSLRWLRHQRWEGNVRELENFLLRQILLTDQRRLTFHNPETETSDSKADPPWTFSFKEAKAAVVTQFECDYLTRLLDETDGNVSQAARLAGKERRALGKLIKKHKIKKVVC